MIASNAAACTSRRVSMNFTASSACSVLRKWLPTADCSTSLTRFRIVPTIEITFGALVSGTWICTCRSIWNTKPSRLLPTIEDSWASRSCASDVASAQFNVRMNVGTISAVVHARVDRVLARAEWLLPDAAVARPHDRPELELRARRVERRKSDEALDDRDLALVHDEHGHQVDAHEERVQQIRAVEERVVLQPDLSAGVDERLVVLVVVVQVVLAAEQHLDEVGVLHASFARLHLGDVVEASEPARDVARRQRRAFERGDHADHVDDAVGRDHDDAELVGGEAERLRNEHPALRLRGELG